MQVYLKVKIKSLAAEAVIIRKDENKAKATSKLEKMRAITLDNNAGLAKIAENRAAKARDAWLGLKAHRRFDVRQESRAAGLAYGFFRGVPYKVIEAKCWEEPNWRRVCEIVRKFGTERDADMVKRLVKLWSEGAEFVYSQQQAASESHVAA
jgi:hypothetical protein